MPTKFITIPDPVQFVDPRTKQTLTGPGNSLSFGDLLHKVMDNPKWGQTYKLIKAADAIMAAYDEADDNVMVLSEEDHKQLKEAVENPKVLVLFDSAPAQTQSGFGIHPRLSRQLIPLCDAVILAEDKDPRKSEDSTVKAV